MNPNRKNLANGILALGVSTSDTTWVLESGYGGSMPAVPFFLTTTPFGQLSTIGNSEIVNVTARSGDTLTVQRAQKGTTARAFAAGSVVSNGVYVEDKVGSENIDFTTFPHIITTGTLNASIIPPYNYQTISANIPTQEDTDYVVLYSIASASAGWAGLRPRTYSKTTSSFTVYLWNDSSLAADPSDWEFVVVRG